jgi:hypothetical protein
MGALKIAGGAPGIRDKPLEAEAVNSASCTIRRLPIID